MALVLSCSHIALLKSRGLSSLNSCWVKPSPPQLGMDMPRPETLMENSLMAVTSVFSNPTSTTHALTTL